MYSNPAYVALWATEVTINPSLLRTPYLSGTPKIHGEIINSQLSGEAPTSELFLFLPLEFVESFISYLSHKLHLNVEVLALNTP